eukprot:361625-Chlamydomonas_euryale.AAC.3
MPGPSGRMCTWTPVPWHVCSRTRNGAKGITIQFRTQLNRSSERSTSSERSRACKMQSAHLQLMQIL